MFFSILTLLLCSQFLGLKADIEILLSDYVVDYYDPEYFRDVETEVWENRIFCNITIINQIPVDAEVRIELLGATMGEYIVPTGINVSLPLCEAYDEPIFVGYSLKYFQPPIDVCPPELGTYIADMNYNDFSVLPDTFRPNNYLLHSTISTSGKLLLDLKSYQRVS